MRTRRTHHDREAERPWKRGRWIWASTLVPALLLPAALLVASAVLPLSSQRPAAPRPQVSPERPETRQLGVTGQLPRQQRPSDQLLDRAGQPRELATGAGAPQEVPNGPLGIPAPVLSAYREGADRLGASEPGCGVDWSVLASIGRIESGHARSGRVDAEGTTVSAILGPRLVGGRGMAAVPDTDRGDLDGDPVWDRAVGPMQFLPSTWDRYAVDASGDGRPNPHNVGDAAATAGRVLCSGGADLREPRELARAVFRYNRSEQYVRTVLVWADAYSRGVTPTPGQVNPQLDDHRDVLAGSRLPDVAAPQEPSAGWPLPVEPARPPELAVGVPPPAPSAGVPPSGLPPEPSFPVEPGPSGTPVPPSSELPAPELPSSELPSSELPSSELPSSELPSSELPSSELPSSELPSPERPSSQLPAPELPSSNPPSSNPPSSNPPSEEFPGRTTEPPTSSEPPTSTQVPGSTRMPSEPSSSTHAPTSTTAPGGSSSEPPASNPSGTSPAEPSTSGVAGPGVPAVPEGACSAGALLPGELPPVHPHAEVDGAAAAGGGVREDAWGGSCDPPSSEPPGFLEAPGN